MDRTIPKTKDIAQGVALPSREDILAFMKREREAGTLKIGKREIGRAFGIKGSDKIALKRILKEMENEGAVEKTRKSFARKGERPDVVVADITARDRDGDLIAKPAEWDSAAHGPAPRIAVDVPRRARAGRASQPAPGLGQRVLVRLTPVEDPEPGAPTMIGRVIKVLEKARDRLLGVYHVTERGARVSPIDKKQLGNEWLVPEGAGGEARDGDLVAVEIRREGRYGMAAVVREVLGSLKSEKAVSLIAIHNHSIPDRFRAETLAEAEAAKPASLSGREDWRSLPLVTIDPPDAKDHDDAVHAAPDEDPANPGGFVVTVAIADVAYYVRPGSALDREAVERGNSVYFPDRVVPMLPERISNDLCSLRGGENRPALAVRLVLGADGRKLRHSFHRIMMKSAARLSYQQAQSAIDGQPDDATGPLLDPVLKPLWAAYAAANRQRESRQPLALDLPERKILLKPDGMVDRVVTPQRLDAHKLIEEFMILANVSAAETLEEKRQILVYRAHDEPSAVKLNALGEFLTSIGIKLAKGQALRPANFNHILEKVRGTEHEALVHEVVLRSQAQAEYTHENYGHFGLNLRRYAHFTSPIRRYADLIVHRALIRALDLGKDGLPDTGAHEMADIAQRISAAERRAMAAERETVDRLIANFLADRIGAEFSGRIAGVTKSGLFVKLTDTGADGFIPASTLGREYFRHEESAHALVGSSTGETYRLGDMVDVRLVEAAPFAGALRFEMLSRGGQNGPRKRISAMKPGARDQKPRSAQGRPPHIKASRKKRR